jgi:hypothetical protein
VKKIIRILKGQSAAEYSEDDLAFWQTAEIIVNKELFQHLPFLRQRTKEDGKHCTTYNNFISYFDGASLRFVQSARVGDDLIFAQGSNIPCSFAHARIQMIAS